ncbi:MAG: right-handed parallel beta-helix repeat-containing protein [Planctomycetaceae bacterium]
MAASCQAETFYVNNLFGNDSNDGLAATDVGAATGPVQTLRRAVRLLSPGDVLSLADTGTPYAGGFALHGVQHSGTPDFPVIIDGNNAVVSGATPIDPAAWQHVTYDIWRITPQRKGWYQLLLNGAVIPEVAVAADAQELPALEFGSWCVFRGVIYYRPQQYTEPQRENLMLATDQTGLTLLDVENVLVRNLTFQHFRQDGIHLHDLCRHVVFVNVRAVENGRAGIVVGGTSEAFLSQVTVTGNRVHSLLIEDLGSVDTESVDLNPEPTVTPLPQP